ncbi:hypothetical protein JCM33374_g6586 [Metschnikowia sp. JCM 33374]|nr:hypothetical protein JCM33374_g6586 [Metschnikowia sp. JCM 33374]
MFLRGGLRSSRIPAICFQRFASSTPAHSKLHPELFNGVFTKFGWVLVKKTHVARGWTQAQINEALEKTLGDPSDNHDWNDIQEAVDDWTNRTCKKTVPQKKKKTLSEAKQEADMKIYLQQVRFNEENTPVPASKTEMKPFKKTTSDSVTFTNARMELLFGGDLPQLQRPTSQRSTTEGGNIMAPVELGREGVL